MGAGGDLGTAAKGSAIDLEVAGSGRFFIPFSFLACVSSLSFNEETAGGGWGIVTAVQKRKYQMICCAARTLSLSTSGRVLHSRFAKGE